MPGAGLGAGLCSESHEVTQSYLWVKGWGHGTARPRLGGMSREEEIGGRGCPLSWLRKAPLLVGTLTDGA